MGELVFVLLLLLVGYITGTTVEKRHYKRIKEREFASRSLPTISFKKHPELENASSTWLVSENVVIGQDYFKRFLASLVNLIGGRVTAYESLVDRARREATLRLKERAKGADMILNFRIETSAIGTSATSRSGVATIEALAYGTAVTLRK